MPLFLMCYKYSLEKRIKKVGKKEEDWTLLDLETRDRKADKTVRVHVALLEKAYPKLNIEKCLLLASPEQKGIWEDCSQGKGKIEKYLGFKLILVPKTTKN